ncbi:MAG: type II toxin-antitoxin system RelE/ParE family toxin [Planctomycetes bacterium]|nr:type II toxin-antitoxin system RelE/ParE family toxin [Planctomycetota bacterium]
MAKIVVTSRAMRDFREIESYSVEQWGRRTADKYLADFEAALVRIEQSPDLLRAEPDVAPCLRFHRVGRHFLVCDVVDETIYLLTVIHCAMDLPARLGELQPTLHEEAELLHRRLKRNGS